MVDLSAGKDAWTSSGRPAVFLDRDGVINDNIFYADTGAWEGPRTRGDFHAKADAIAAMADLAAAGFMLFIVSNQPNQAKGKATRADHDAIHMALLQILAARQVPLAEAYYCFHHPQGIDPLLGRSCECRKPSPYFVFRARDEHGADLSRSWFVGDREADVEAGRRAGLRTIRIVGAEASPWADDTLSDAVAADLGAAAALILAANSDVGAKNEA